MRIIAIGGEPGSGKTTLMKALMEKYPTEKKYDSFKLVPYHQKDSLYILGKYEEGEVFSGTDRMSMAVQPAAIEFLGTLPSDSVVLFEGDRLFTASFLENCLDKYDLDIVYLSTEKETREERYKERGSEQNETWLAGRITKINNILTNMTLMFNVTKFKNDTLSEQGAVIDYLVEKIEG